MTSDEAFDQWYRTESERILSNDEWSFRFVWSRAWDAALEEALDAEFADPSPNPFDTLYCLLWSRSQGALHIETLGESMMDAMAMLRNERDHGDWITLTVGPEGFIRKTAAELRPVVDARMKADVALGLVAT